MNHKEVWEAASDRGRGGGRGTGSVEAGGKGAMELLYWEPQTLITQVQGERT